MNSKNKGNIGQALTLAQFTKRNIQVSIPFGDNARYDLIAEFNGKLNKIQVKYCNQKLVNNAVACPCASSTNHTTNKHYTTYQNDIDYFVFYLVEWNELIIVPIQDIGDKKTIYFRKDIPSGCTKNYHLVKDYTFSKFFNDNLNIFKEIQQKQNIIKNTCIDCGAPISDNATRCRSCAAKKQPRKVQERPSREKLKDMIRNTPFTKIAEEFNVSDKAITKWCIAMNLPSRKKDIKKYTDQQWLKI